MEKLRAPVAISAALHAATVGWLVTRAFAPAQVSSEAATLTPIEIVPVTPAAPLAAPAPVDVAPVEEPAVPPAATATTRPLAPRPAPPAPEPADQAALAITVPAAPEPTGATPPARPSLLSMRHGEAPRLALPSGRWDDLDHPPAGTTPERERRTGFLREAGRGRYESQQGVFVGKVSPDGSVAIQDSPNLHVHLALPTPKSLGRAFARWYDSDKGPYGAEGDTSMARQIQVSLGPTTDQPSAATSGQLRDQAITVIVPVLSGGFDVSDWLMRRNGSDPYASKKLAFLDATRDERVQIGNRHRARQLALTPQIVQRNLTALWAQTDDMRVRKRALFELWDECTETGEPAVVEAGQAARRLVIGFIRARLPAGSADAFTPAELAELARTQQSKATFQPYE